MGMRSRAGGQHWKWIVVPLLAGCGAMVGQDRIPLCPRAWVSIVLGRKAFPGINCFGNRSAVATSFSRSTCRKGPASASAAEMLDAFSFTESCGTFCLCPQDWRNWMPRSR